MSNHQISKLRVVFIGCVKEGKECLQEVIEVGSDVVAVFTFTDELAAKMSGSVSFDDITEQHGIPLFKVKSTNTPETAARIRDFAPDVVFVTGWTRLVSSEIINIPKYGCIGMHASLLPRYRGRAPVNWAIINNERVTGNSTILLDDGVDTGKVLAQQSIVISTADTCGTLYDKVAWAGRKMIGEILQSLSASEIPGIPQDEREATVMPKRTPDDGIIDWSRSALELFNWVRALTHPYPGAFTFLQEGRLFIWEVRVAHFSEATNGVSDSKDVSPGTVVSTSDGIAVLTGGMELVTIHRLSLEGEPEMTWQEFVKGHHLRPGDVLGT